MLQLLLKKLVITTNKKPSLRQGFLFSALILFIILWFSFLEHIHYQCPFLALFHLYCPGCGGTRMVVALLHLDFYQAFRWNPFLFITFIVVFIYLIVMTIIYIKKKVFVIPSIKVWIIYLILAVGFMIIRNIPAFVYLIPTEV